MKISKTVLILTGISYLIVLPITAFDRSIQTPPASPHSGSPSAPETNLFEEIETGSYDEICSGPLADAQKLECLRKKARNTLDLPENRELIKRNAQTLLNDFKGLNPEYLAYLQDNLNPRNWEEEKERVMNSYRDLLNNPDLSRAWRIVNEEILKEFEKLLENLFMGLFRAHRVWHAEKE